MPLWNRRTATTNHNHAKPLVLVVLIAALASVSTNIVAQDIDAENSEQVHQWAPLSIEIFDESEVVADFGPDGMSEPETVPQQVTVPDFELIDEDEVEQKSESQSVEQLEALPAPLTKSTLAPATPQDSDAVEFELYEVNPEDQKMLWWQDPVGNSILDKPKWVAFGLDGVLIDTLRSSPRIKVVAGQTSLALERVIQQDAAFDASVLFDSTLRRNNDPVGNTLTTGGPSRLVEESFSNSLGIRRTTRRGGIIDLSQDLGLLDSNSTFFSPTNQGNARLSLSLTQPLLSRGKQVYNERLLLQAQIDSRVSWEDLQVEVENRLVEVVRAYWNLYELRCHLLQNAKSLEQGREIMRLLEARKGFDAGLLEMAKIRQRVSLRHRQAIVLEAEVRKAQSRLAALVGAEQLSNISGSIEMIPTQSPNIPHVEWDLKSAVQLGLENRPDIRSATSQLEAAALSIRVTRAELEPQLNAIFDAYLSGLNGSNQAFRSFTDQFTTGAPGFSAGIQYELPIRGRAAKSRHREARHEYRIRSEELREAVQRSQAEIEIALIDFQTAATSRKAQREVLKTAIEEEQILTRRWESLGADGSIVAVALESLLDAQQRCVDAERDWVTAQTGYVVALVDLQRAMGSLLTHTGIKPIKGRGNEIRFTSELQKEPPSAEMGVGVHDQLMIEDPSPSALK